MYSDFQETNVIWTWVLNPTNTGFSYEQYHVDQMIFGDTDSGGFLIPENIAETNDLDAICNFADEVGRLTNDSFPEFVQYVFNCPEERKNTIKTNREVVSDKSLFLNKKRYIMHMVDKEGTRVDKLKIMGVELKKSGTSVFLKRVLTELVNRILDGESREQVHIWSNGLKKEIEKCSVVDLYTPISTKTLKKCQNIYEMTGNMNGFPYQVRAAMFYNSMCSVSDRRINPGEKVGLIYINHPDCKYIAVPIDAEVLPKWFDDIKVDYKTTWDKIHKKIVNYITALGWDYDSRKVEIRETLFGF